MHLLHKPSTAMSVWLIIKSHNVPSYLCLSLKGLERLFFFFLAPFSLSLLHCLEVQTIYHLNLKTAANTGCDAVVSFDRHAALSQQELRMIKHKER